MLSKEKIDQLKDSFYGWEYCVQNNIAPTMTAEDINLLTNLFIDIEDLSKENMLLYGRLNNITSLASKQIK